MSDNRSATASPSRRGVLAILLQSSAAAVATAATIAPASPAPATKPAAADPVAPPIAPAAIATEPTPIARLWAERNAVREQVRAAYRIVHQIESKAWRRVGPVDPAIAYSAANDRLGLERMGWNRTPYIDPRRIEMALRKINGELSEWSTFQRRRPIAVSKRDAKREQRLKDLLKISEEHDGKVRALRDGLGFQEANQKAEALLNRQGDLECRIVKKRSANVGDLQIKFAIVEINGCADKEDFESIARDVHRLMSSPALTQAFAEA